MIKHGRPTKSKRTDQARRSATGLYDVVVIDEQKAALAPATSEVR